MIRSFLQYFADLGSRSTAKKILKGIRDKYVASIRNQHYLSDVIIDQDKMIDTLGRAIENVIDYPQYQVLSDVEKNKFRELIVNKLFQAAMPYRQIAREGYEPDGRQFGFIWVHKKFDYMDCIGMGFPEELFYPKNNQTDSLERLIREALQINFKNLLQPNHQVALSSLYTNFSKM